MFSRSETFTLGWAQNLVKERLDSEPPDMSEDRFYPKNSCLMLNVNSFWTGDRLMKPNNL